MGTTGHVDLFATVLQRWRVVVVCAVLGVAAAVAYAFVATPWYEARLTVVPSQRSPEGMAMSLVAKIPGLDTASVDSKRIEAVLTSFSVTDEVIAKFDLKKRYGTPYSERAREAVWTHCSTSVDRKSGVVALTCEDTDPETAMQIVSYFGEVGNRTFNRISSSSAREEVHFLETQLTTAHDEVVKASQALREFQEKNKIIDLPEQSKATISAMASIEGDLVSKQLELSYLTGFASRGEGSVVQLQQQIAIMQSKLKELESRPQPKEGLGSGSANVFPSVMNVPELRFELEALMREQKIKETAFLLLTQRYELARIEAARDTSSFQILDSPTKPTVRSRPKRRKIAMLGLFAGLALAGVWIFGPMGLERVRGMRRA